MALSSNLSNLRLVLQPKQTEVFRNVEYGRSPWIGYGGGRGGAKALHVDTPIPTPLGWSRIGDLRPGDQVFDENGAVCSVVAISGVMLNDAIKLTFDEGTEMVSDVGHQWHCFSKSERKEERRKTEEFRAMRRSSRASRSVRGRAWLGLRNAILAAERRESLSRPPRGSVRTSEEIAANLYVHGGREVNWSIRNAQAIQMGAVDLPIDPYVLGVWLGDGHTRSGCVTSADPEVLANVAMRGWEVHHTEKYDWRVSGFTTTLRKVGLLHNKHVPRQYLRASVSQRLDLLRGLMDTDGTIADDGGAAFCNTNERLVDAVYELASSLGIKATVREARAKLYGKDCGPYWKVSWTDIVQVFSLPRKAEKINKRRRGTQIQRYIKQAVAVGIQSVCCISVDSPSRLYLASKAMIPTHNSGGLQRIMLARRLKHKGTLGCILMRNSDQVERYHENVMKRTWPQLEDLYLSTKRKIVIPFDDPLQAPSEIQFSYAESLDDVIRRFRSANYFDIFIDQAEQFTEAELREIRQAVRWPDVAPGTCKLVLAHNMGGAGISFLRKKFHLLEYNVRERKEDFVFTHVRPYDNVEWVRPALQEDGLDEGDYYAWPEEIRKKYCAERSDYGQGLVSQDEVLVKRDFDGSWDSLEGSYFEYSFDRDSTVQVHEVCRMLIRPWWEMWMSMDWGRGHFCITYWHARGMLSPAEARAALGWEIRAPIRMVVTFREFVAGGSAAKDGGGGRVFDEDDIGRELVDRTPSDEKDRLIDFVLSPDAFHKRTQDKTIAAKLGEKLKAGRMREPRAADDDRKNGWALMANMLLSTKRHGSKGDDAWIISANCPQLIDAIPLAQREPKDLDDVLKTDKSQAKIEQDAMDSARYGIRFMARPGQKPAEVEAAEKMQEYRETGLDERSLMIYAMKEQERVQNANRAPSLSSHRWKGKVRR